MSMDEYIKKSDVLKLAYKSDCEWHHDEHPMIIEASDIEALPAADVAPVVRGKWVDGHCDKCGFYGAPTFDGDNEKTAFCPNCGAHMNA